MIGTPALLGLVVASAGFVSPFDKVRPGAPPPSPAAKAQLSLAAGECEGTQVWVPPPAQDVQVQTEAWKGPLSVRLYRVAYVPVKIPSNSEGAPGLWPDPLVPVPLDGRARASSTEREPLVLYLELCAAPDAPSLTRRGALQLTHGEKTQSLPFEVQVQPFRIPATSSLPNSFGLSVYSIAQGHKLDPASSQARALLRDYARALLEHRLSAYGMGMDPIPSRGGRLDFSAYDEEMSPFLDGTALPSGARFSSTDVRDLPKKASSEERERYYRAFREHFDRKGWKATLFFYAKDEPTPEDVPWVLEQSRLVRRARAASVLVTAPFDDTLGPAADILTPTLNCFFPRPGEPTCKNVLEIAALRKALGSDKRVWWYQSCNSHGCKHGPFTDPRIESVYRGWASYMVDHPVTLNRAMGALAYLTGVDGELYFDTVYAYHQGDPWKDVFAFGGNGDGTLFYPGRPEAHGTHQPIPSLRLKAIRDGLEDYEYLKLHEARYGRDATVALARQLASSGYEITRDVKAWEAVRARLTRQLRQPKVR